MIGRIDDIRVTRGTARYPRPPWYIRLWRWARGGFKRKQPFPDSDPYFSSVVFLAHFDGHKGKTPTERNLR